jgi:predicted nucleic acid-binding protein
VGLTVADAGVVIAYLDPSDAHAAAASVALLDARARLDRIVLPISAYSECLVEPTRRGPDALNLVQEAVAEYPLELTPISVEVAEAAARLRAAHGPRLRLPDALVVATAQVLDADRLVTTDHRWPDAATLPFRGELVVL